MGNLVTKPEKTWKNAKFVNHPGNTPDQEKSGPKVAVITAAKTEERQRNGTG